MAALKSWTKHVAAPRLRERGFAAAWLLIAFTGLAVAQEQDTGTVLVSPAWLSDRLAVPNVRIIDLGKTRPEFDAAHIPNAQFVDWRVDIVDPANAQYFAVAPQASIESLLSKLGVTPETTIVLYDSQSSRIAARMFWVLRYYGHRDVRILDGGANAWAAAGGAQTDVVATIMPTEYRVGERNESLRAEYRDVAAAVANSSAQFVDARAPEFYTGESVGSQYRSDRPNAAAGHIPGAENFFWADHFNADGTFKSVAELRARYQALGIEPDRAVISYCHVGLQASTPWFVLSQLLGYPDVRLYDRSMAEWANVPDAPMSIGAGAVGQ
jgi:thiosulfate/3-mercaptopyruvate sulfurtransferase